MISYAKIIRMLNADAAWAKKHRRPVVFKRAKELLAKIAARKA